MDRTHIHPLRVVRQNRNLSIQNVADATLLSQRTILRSLVHADSVALRWHALLEISKAQAYCDAGVLSSPQMMAKLPWNMVSYGSQSGEK